MTDSNDAPTDDQVRNFEYLSPMLDSALQEMREFAKRKQDGIVSATKIKLVNRILADIRAILLEERSLQYLEALSESELPQNSDVVLVLGQYRAALDSFKDRHYRTVDYSKRWITKEWLTAHEAPPDEDEDEDSSGDDEADDEQ